MVKKLAAKAPNPNYTTNAERAAFHRAVKQEKKRAKWQRQNARRSAANKTKKATNLAAAAEAAARAARVPPSRPLHDSSAQWSGCLFGNRHDTTRLPLPTTHHHQWALLAGYRRGGRTGRCGWSPQACCCHRPLPPQAPGWRAGGRVGKRRTCMRACCYSNRRRGAMHMAISSWNSSLHAYGMKTCGGVEGGAG